MIKDNLQAKLDRIKTGNYRPEDFIIADAKDGDMAFGITAPGPCRSDGQSNGSDGDFLNRAAYLQNMTDIANSDLIDILLMSASSAEQLTNRGVLQATEVTPAIRFNDTTDIWSARGSTYNTHASRPFATVDAAQAAGLCQFGLYSLTFSNDRDRDLETLEHYRQYRLVAREHGLQHILEVFNPAFDIGLKGAEIGDYINDMIVKTLAGVCTADAPLFLKVQFNGARCMRALSSYDPDNLVVGILGGAAGTTRDTFELLLQAETAGARVALFGRKINLSESPLELLRLMREVLQRNKSPEEAVNDYHQHLDSRGLVAIRKLSADLEITETVLKG